MKLFSSPAPRSDALREVLSTKEGREKVRGMMIGRNSTQGHREREVHVTVKGRSYKISADLGRSVAVGSK